ncbi:hypothetical protein AAKU52_003489 [Pedobacter sp. CG_S7]|uniref:hypothetical protein n=1 Tax=Pedobacter sp. CG_S7 TaxID=3143930 RepID=UPI0033923677
MKIKPILILYLIGTIFLLSCQDKKKIVSFENVLEHSLEYLLSTRNLAKEYYENPLKIIRPKDFPITSDIVVNHKKSILLPEGTDPFDLMEGMDIFKPVPIVEISNYSQIDDKIKIKITLRATGGYYQITLKGDDDSGYKVINVNEGEI